MPDKKQIKLKLADWFALTIELDDCVLSGPAQVEVIEFSKAEPVPEIQLNPEIDRVTKEMVVGRQPPVVSVRFRFDEAMLTPKGD